MLGQWPIHWKSANIIPLPKDVIPNYLNIRPISILPTLNKCFEQLLKSRIMPYYTKHIDKSQYGFIPMGSTASALIAILDKIYTLLDSPEIKSVSLISFDFRKAFDKVNHQILLNKLTSFLPHNFIPILSSYLQQRRQRVQLNKSFSEFCDIDCGVPQGSVLSPILFNLFICDLTDTPKSFCFKYADDSTFILPHYSLNITEDVKYTFDYVSDWCNNNKLQLNVDKTKLMIFKKHYITYNTTCSLTPVSHLKLLGVTIENNLKWDKHIQSTIKAASSSLYLLRKCHKIFNKQQLIMLYNSFVLSKLCYAASAFISLPQKHCRPFKKLLTRAHFIICGYD